MKVLILLSLVAVACASIYDHHHHYEEILPSHHGYHPALLGHHYPLQKVVVQYPSGIYHGPHGPGIYDPELHDKLEQDYYRG